MKILFLVPYPSEGASNRVRVEQFIPHLKSKSVLVRVRPFINKRFYKVLYLPHAYLEKIFWFIISTLNRLLDIIRAVRYDIVFIHREAYPLGGALIESLLHRMGKPLVFDFDDAIFLPNTSRENKYIDKFKRPGKILKIIEMSRLVIAGNEYLKNFALKYNNNVVVIPSSVDTERYVPRPPEPAGKDVVIGWIGSNTTRDFLQEIENALVKVSEAHKNVTFKIVGAEFHNPKLNNVINKVWSLEDEVRDMQSFDIGIMPLSDSEWTKGKCGFKAILYMACGLPVVASPVGVNTQIVEDGVTGFLARTEDGWVRKLKALIEDAPLRMKMGEKGREKIIKEYSLFYTAPVLYKNLIKVYDETKK